MSISEQVRELRETSDGIDTYSDMREYSGLSIAVMLNEAADTIESLSEKLQSENMERPAEDFGGWIPCSEKLPMESKEVICFFKDGTISACMLIYNRFHGKMYSYDVSDALCWKPLPEPPYEP